MLERRKFLAKAGGAEAVAAAVIADAPAVIAQPKVQWRMSTAWPPQLDMLQGSAQHLAQVVEEMSARLARARHRGRVRLQQESVRGAPGRPETDPRSEERRVGKECRSRWS